MVVLEGFVANLWIDLSKERNIVWPSLILKLFGGHDDQFQRQPLSERCDFECRGFLSSLWRILSLNRRNNGRV